MFKDRKIRKELKKELEPKIPFEDFCQRNGIILDEPVKKQNKAPLTLFTKIIGPIAVTCVLVLSIVLPIQLTNKGTTPGTGKPPVIIVPPGDKVYGENDVKKMPIEIEQIALDETILFFDASGAQEIGLITQIQPIEEPSITLAYTIDNVIYGFFINETLYAFEFDYVVRLYEKYEFLQLSLFDGLNENVVTDSTACEYKIVQDMNGSNAYIAFKKADVEYFVILREFGGMTEINKENVELFIENVL